MSSPDDSAVGDVAEHIAARLEEDGLPYAFGGAIALGAWGVPRATIDVDVAVFVSLAEIDRALSAIERAGALLRRGEIRRQADRLGMFVTTIRGVRVDVFLSHHPMHGDMERRRVSLPFGDVNRYFLSPEDVALTKLIYRRDKDVVDLERLFAVQAGRLDVEYVRQWLARITPDDSSRAELLDDLVARFGAED